MLHKHNSSLLSNFCGYLARVTDKVYDVSDDTMSRLEVTGVSLIAAKKIKVFVEDNEPSASQERHCSVSGSQLGSNGNIQK